MIETALAREKEDVRIARARLADTIAALKFELAPRTMARNAVHGITEKGEGLAAQGMDVAKRHSLPAAGAVAALGLFLARRPLARLFTRRGHATPPSSAS